MAQLTVRDAALRAGISRQTMFRYIEQGRISATNNRAGQKQIAVSELLRVFGELQPETVTETTAATVRGTRKQSPDSLSVTAVQQLEIAQLKGQLELATERLQMAQERISELKTTTHELSEEKGRLLTVIERQTLLLAAPVAQPTVRPHGTAKTVPATKTVKPAPIKASKPAATVKKPPVTVKKTVARPLVQPAKTPSKIAPKAPSKAATARKTTPAKPVDRAPTKQKSTSNAPQSSLKKTTKK